MQTTGLAEIKLWAEHRMGEEPAEFDTVRGVMLKVCATWHPADREDLQANGCQMLVSALADLERLTGIELDRSPEA